MKHLLYAFAIAAIMASCNSSSDTNENKMTNDESDRLAKNKAIAQKCEDAFNAGDTTIVDSIVAKDVTDHNPPPGMTGKGSEELKKIITSYHTAFPDGKSTLVTSMAEGDMVMNYGTYEGTNSGSFMGMPATGKAVKFDYADVFKISDGKIVEHWGIIDGETMMNQMGMMPDMSKPMPMDDKMKMEKKK